MTAALPPDLLEAARLTRSGRLTEATALLQRALRGEVAPSAAAPETPPAGRPAGVNASAPRPGYPGQRAPRIIDVEPETGAASPNAGADAGPGAGARPGPGATSPFGATSPSGAGRATPREAAAANPWAQAAASTAFPAGGAMPPMPEALRSFLGTLGQGNGLPGGGLPAGGLPGGGAQGGAMPAWEELMTRPSPVAEKLPEGARFLSGDFSAEAGSRPYKLYIPASHRGAPAPLVVMLHGCTQSPDDFAAGTRMNALAEEHGLLVLYPAQPSRANAQKCWNWFSPSDQQRGQGEPSLIAGMTRQVMREHGIDPRRVFIAGLSAGGAAAAIMGQSYPELYAAIGVHSGLACGAARDMPSAFAAMRQGAAGLPLRAGEAGPVIPAIVFHADRDTTVHPRNGDQVIAQSAAAAPAALRTEVQRGQVTGGHAYTRTLHADAAGQPVLEQWLVHGGGHAWSGGSAAGTYTDPRGPDASREMLRFFLEHPRAVAP